MASPDANGMVIYLGKLGQSLPSFQTGFVVAPEKFRSQELFKCWTAKAI
jgi:GntR family transcriptional regulator/MocR family aminotransferase